MNQRVVIRAAVHIGKEVSGRNRGILLQKLHAETGKIGFDTNNGLCVGYRSEQGGGGKEPSLEAGVGHEDHNYGLIQKRGRENSPKNRAQLTISDCVKTL